MRLRATEKQICAVDFGSQNWVAKNTIRKPDRLSSQALSGVGGSETVAALSPCEQIGAGCGVVCFVGVWGWGVWVIGKCDREP